MDEGAIELSKNKYEIDMCNGTIMDKLVSFAIPLMVSGILQLMFNAVDIIVVGRFSGSQALAAVGSRWEYRQECRVRLLTFPMRFCSLL